jgi:hypothetical protein
MAVELVTGPFLPSSDVNGLLKLTLFAQRDNFSLLSLTLAPYSKYDDKFDFEENEGLEVRMKRTRTVKIVMATKLPGKKRDAVIAKRK